MKWSNDPSSSLTYFCPAFRIKALALNSTFIINGFLEVFKENSCQRQNYFYDFIQNANAGKIAGNLFSECWQNLELCEMKVVSLSVLVDEQHGKLYGAYSLSGMQ